MAPNVLTSSSPPHTPSATNASADWLEEWACTSPTGGSGTLAHAWLESLRVRLGANQAVLAWYERGHARIALHLGQRPSPSPVIEQLITAALDEAVDQGVCLRVSAEDAPVEASHTHASPIHITRALRQATPALVPGGTSIGLPLPGADQPMGALLLCWANGQAPSPDAQALLTHAAQSAAPLLQLQRLSERPWHWHVRKALVSRWKHCLHARDASMRRRRWLAATALVGLVLMPLPQRLGGHARIEGLQQRVLSAPTDGFVKAAHALPGDRVKEGEVLVDLVDQDLRLEREKWLSQVSQFDNAYASAMTRGDRAEASIGLSRLEEAQAQLALVDEQLQRSQLKAPFNGVVIQGDLSHAIGAPVKQGDALITVASEQGHRLIMDIEEGDIGLIQAGQRGHMALSALPWQTLDFSVRRITPQAVAKEGRNVYEVEAAFDGPLPEGIRPGLMGPAKVLVGHQPLLWTWLRPVMDKVRLWWWAWGT
jgi:Barrel-sandwich domain of CusB or HlyD membrane-fusion